MTEQYYGGSRKMKKLSRWMIEQMQKHMKKVPEIQEKAQHYQKKEEKEAEQKLEQYLNAA
jgi:hypothetical protein